MSTDPGAAVGREQYNLHAWMRFGGPTQCAKCGVWLTIQASSTLCAMPNSPGVRLVRDAGRRALAAETRGGRGDGEDDGARTGRGGVYGA